MNPTDLGLVFGQLLTYREIHGNPPDRHLRDGEAEAARILDDATHEDLEALDEFLASQGFALYIKDGMELGIPRKGGRPNTLYVITRKRGEGLAPYLDKGWFLDQIRDGRRRGVGKSELVVWMARMWLTLQWFFYQKKDRLPSEVSRYRDAVVSTDAFVQALEQGIEQMGNAGRPEGPEGIAYDYLWENKGLAEGYAMRFLKVMEEAGMIQGAGNPGEYRQTLVAAVDMAVIAQNELAYLMPADTDTRVESRTVELITGETRGEGEEDAGHPEN